MPKINVKSITLICSNTSHALEAPFPVPALTLLYLRPKKKKKILMFMFFISFCSMYTPIAPINGTMNVGATRRPPAPAVSSVSRTQLGNGNDHDFSSLTQGMFTKQ